MQGQLQSLQEAVKDKEGTIETLERQLVQAGIKGKVQDAEMEINKKKEEVKQTLTGLFTDTEAKQKVLRENMKSSAEKAIVRMEEKAKTAAAQQGSKLNIFTNNLQNQIQNDLENNEEDS